MFIVKVETERRYGYIRKINDDDDYVNGWWTPPESYKARSLFAWDRRNIARMLIQVVGLVKVSPETSGVFRMPPIHLLEADVLGGACSRGRANPAYVVSLLRRHNPGV